MSMTKKDFEDLAQIIGKHGICWAAAIDLVDFCANRNENFDEEKFIEACGFDYLEYLDILRYNAKTKTTSR